MEQEILKRLEEQEKKIAEIYVSVEKTRKYIFWTVVVTAVLFILPLIGLAFALPSYISTLNSTINSF